VSATSDISARPVEEWCAAYSARDVDALCRLAHPDIEIVPVAPVLGKLPGATFHGHEGVRTLVRWSYENYPRLRLESCSTRILSGGVMVSASYIVEDRPQIVRKANYLLCKLAGDRVRSIYTFATQQEALAAGRSAQRNGALLTRREREVLQLLARGLNAPQIGATLFVSPATVRTHVQNAMTRLGASTRIHAVTIAIERGEIEP
jgi:DNA-binding CsgD family transcriptional regulator